MTLADRQPVTAQDVASKESAVAQETASARTPEQPSCRYQLFLKHKVVEVQPEPCTYYATREMAEARIPVLEKQFPVFSGMLEVRPAGNEIAVHYGHK